MQNVQSDQVHSTPISKGVSSSLAFSSKDSDHSIAAMRPLLKVDLRHTPILDFGEFCRVLLKSSEDKNSEILYPDLANNPNINTAFTKYKAIIPKGPGHKRELSVPFSRLANHILQWARIAGIISATRAWICHQRPNQDHKPKGIILLTWYHSGPQNDS